MNLLRMSGSNNEGFFLLISCRDVGTGGQGDNVSHTLQ